MKENYSEKLLAIVYAVLAAAFFAMNTPISKILLKDVEPTFMAAFLYLGAGIGVGFLYIGSKISERKMEEKKKGQDQLTRANLPYTLGMILLDIAAPIFLMYGIRLGSAANASLLGNFEIVATSLLALLLFKEAVSKRLWLAIGAITLSTILLSVEGSDSFRFSVGSLFVILATMCWGLENNCTRRLSDKNTYVIVMLKGIFSGGGSFLIACFMGEKMPEVGYIWKALCLGFVAYGLSIFLYIRAQRSLGAAKTSAYYAIAPFIGALVSFVLLGEKMTLAYLLALFFMILGTLLVVRDTMVRHHIHYHSHTIVHSHGGRAHVHTISHSHDHEHYLAGTRHGHHHKRASLYHEHQEKIGSD